MNYHFIAIGGAAMHNLALELHNLGHTVTGSDDEIFEPSRSRLANAGLLPTEMGWFPHKLNDSIDAIILGMHARQDNPELLQAQALGLTIYSYPEFLYQHAANKIRVVIGGSHGKTSVTGMVMHVLKAAGKDFDYMVGSQVKGFDTMVKLTHRAPFMVIEGDEYLTSPIDPRPKFHLYKPNIALVTGIAWDHINVFPTFANYVEQFNIFIDLIEPQGTLIYYQNDPELVKLAQNANTDITTISYTQLPAENTDGVLVVTFDGQAIPLNVIGNHNLQNLAGALQVCKACGVSEADFFQHIQTFEGAAKRLETLKKTDDYIVYRDFAHAPSKVQATVESVKNHYANRTVNAVFELHTYSSLNKTFLQQYAQSLAMADNAAVFYSQHALELKRLDPLDPAEVAQAFGKQGLQVFTSKADLENYLNTLPKNNAVLLLMSSGNFEGIDLAAL